MTSKTIYQPITPTYLYIKQHSITKKKYFGKTTSKDPYKYKGSGEYWNNHIKKHGRKHIVTLWVSDLYYDTSIVGIALKFSADNNIVESKEWANLEPENGLNGGAPGRKLGPHSVESNAKRSASMKGKNTWLHSAEVYAKQSATRTGVPMPKFFSIIETRKTYDKGNLSKWHPEFKQYY